VNQNTRINPTDDVKTTIAKLSGGNPGALAALMAMFQESPTIDPDCAFGGLGPLMSLDSCGIYGTDIYVLFSDICGRDVTKTLAVLRATQLGEFSADTLADACSRQDYSGREMVPVDELYAKVKERLPNFNASVLDAETIG
jgi:hypothetical protein